MNRFRKKLRTDPWDRPGGPFPSPRSGLPEGARARGAEVWRHLAAVFWLLGAGGGLAWAQVENDFSGMSLEDLMGLEVFSAATLLPTSLKKAPGTVYSFGRRDFERLGVRTLDQLLRFVPGFQLNQYRKRHQSLWARGTLSRDNNKLVLLIDGIQRRHFYYGHFSAGDSLNLDKVEKVEVLLGPASSLYGANAFAGMISVTTRDFTREPILSLGAEVGNHDHAQGTALYRGPRALVFASRLDQDAPFSAGRKSFIGGETLQPLDEDYNEFFVKIQPLPGLTLSLDYQANDTPFVFIPATQDSFIEERPLTLAAAFDWGEVATGRIEARAYYTRDQATEREIEQETRILAYREEQNAALAGATLTAFHRWQERHVATLGLSWQHEQAEDFDTLRFWSYRDGLFEEPQYGSLLSEPDIRNDDFAVFAQDVWELREDLTLTLGLRHDAYEVFGHYTNYRLAAVYSPTPQQVVKLLYGTALRTPTPREYLKVLDGTSFEAPIPDPERLRSLELGYSYQWAQANLNLTAYRNAYDDYIHEVPTPDGADEYFANSDEPWKIWGLEALIEYRPDERWQLRLGAAYLDARRGETGRLPYLASWSGSFNLNYHPRPGHQAGFSLLYNSPRVDTNSYPEDDLDAFLQVNVHASGPLTPRLRYAFGIDNLLDQRIYDPAGDFGEQYNTEKSERQLWLRLVLELDL